MKNKKQMKKGKSLPPKTYKKINAELVQLPFGIPPIAFQSQLGLTGPGGALGQFQAQIPTPGAPGAALFGAQQLAGPAFGAQTQLRIGGYGPVYAGPRGAYYVPRGVGPIYYI